MNGDDLVLVPRPRRLVVHPGPRIDVESLDVVHHDEPRLEAEGFELDVRPDEITVRSAGGITSAGARHAEAVRRQLARQPGGVPPLDIADAPDLERRGYMLDISRDRVPTRTTLARLVEVLALARFNELQLYMEHTFAYRDHETVWRDASPLTADDIRWLDETCAAAGIELVPNQNVFGHFGRWLAHDAYRHRAETPEGFELMPGVTLPPAVLAPNEDNARFALGLLEELLACFTSRRVNIGCDETVELGRGASRAQVVAGSRGRVFLDHVLRIARPLLDGGYEVQVWDDMLRRAPTLVRDLPDGVVVIPWAYERPRPPGELTFPGWFTDLMGRLGHDVGLIGRGFGRILDRYHGEDGEDGQDGHGEGGEGGEDGDVTQAHDGAGRTWVLAPGTSTWNSLVGRIDNGVANVQDATTTGRERGAAGILLTDWGDHGHLQPPAVSLPAIVSGGALAWCTEANRDLDTAAVLDTFVFDDDTRRLGAALDRLGRLWGRTGQQALNGSPLQAALLPSQVYFVFGDPDPAAAAEVADDLDDLLNEVAASKPTCPDAEAVVAELVAVTRLARHGAWRLRAKSHGTTPDDPGLRDDLGEAIELQRQAWLARSRPGGLTDSLQPLVEQLSG